MRTQAEDVSSLPSSEDDDLIANGIDRTDTIQLLNPHFFAESRQSSLMASVFTLVCSIMGGTLLSLPWAIQQAGLVMGVLSIFFWSLMADFSIYILVMCARRGGDATYEEVAQRAFGPRMKMVVVVQLIILCWLSTIGYIVLSGTMAHNVLRAMASWAGSELPSWFGTKVTMVFVALYVMPRCFATQLSSLKWTSMFSFFSILLLVLVVSIRSIQRLADPSSHPVLHVQVWPKSWEGVPYSLPVFSAAFVCHFNVLPMHTELQHPTRQRLRSVLHIAIQSCMLVYLALGTLGYLYDRGQTCDNIMSNFCDTDAIAFVGRVALVLTITFNLPLLVIPCRSNIERLFERSKLPVEETAPDLTPFAVQSPRPSSWWPQGEQLDRAIKTVLIVSTACFAACYVPGVSVVWTITGSTVSLSVAFVMPCAFYLKLRGYKPWNARKLLAAVLLGIACLSIVACTFEAVKHVVSGHSSSCPNDFDPCT